MLFFFFVVVVVVVLILVVVPKYPQCTFNPIVLFFKCCFDLDLFSLCQMIKIPNIYILLYYLITSILIWHSGIPALAFQPFWLLQLFFSQTSKLYIAPLDLTVPLTSLPGLQKNLPLYIQVCTHYNQMKVYFPIKKHTAISCYV